jgi:hypothetical protein
MNFFGHAVVASWQSSEPAFVLGAMLPDLAEILSARLARAKDPLIASGVRCHLATDRCFHRSDVFRALESQALAELAALGVGKGPRRGVAHIGVELLIDDQLATDESARDVFHAALSWAAQGGADDGVEWSPMSGPPALGGLCGRLLEVGRSNLRLTPERLAVRLARILEHRPRLALEPRDAQAIARWAHRAGSEVERLLPSLIAELEREPELARPWRP